MALQLVWLLYETWNVVANVRHPVLHCRYQRGGHGRKLLATLRSVSRAGRRAGSGREGSWPGAQSLPNKWQFRHRSPGTLPGAMLRDGAGETTDEAV